MKNLLPFLLVLWALLPHQSHAQANSKATTSKQTAVPAQQPMPVGKMDTLMSEKDYYRMMYNLSNTNTEKANTLTQWTLGSVAIVIVLIIGLQFLFNRELNITKLNAIRNDMQSQVTAMQVTILARLSEEGANIESRLRAKNGLTDRLLADFISDYASTQHAKGENEDALGLALKVAEFSFEKNDFSWSNGNIIGMILNRTNKGDLSVYKVNELNKFIPYMLVQAGSSGTARLVSEAWLKGIAKHNAP